MAVLEVAQSVKRVVLLTGTPSLSRFVNIHSWPLANSQVHNISMMFVFFQTNVKIWDFDKTVTIKILGLSVGDWFW